MADGGGEETLLGWDQKDKDHVPAQTMVQRITAGAFWFFAGQSRNALEDRRRPAFP
jgi:hypothetical protein